MPKHALPRNGKRLERLPPGLGGAQRMYIDSGHAGLALRVGANSATWTLTTRVRRAERNVQTRIALGSLAQMSLADARTAATAMQRQIKSGVDPLAQRRAPGAPASVSPFSAVCSDYLATVKPKLRPTTLEGYASVLRRPDLAAWSERPIDKISRADVMRVTDRLVREGKAFMARRMTRTLSALFNYALERELVGINPAQPRVRGKRDDALKPRERVLSDDELVAFWLGIDLSPMSEGMRALLKVVLATGQRPGDCRLMEHQDVDLATGLWTIPAHKHKSRKQHVVPLSPLAVETLRRVEKRGSYVFTESGQPYNRGTLSRAVATWQKQSGARRFTVHDLRRTARTVLARIGVSHEVAERVVGHVVGSAVSRVYDRHDYEAEKRDALNKLGAHLYALAGKALLG
jgi:integrase